MKVISSKQIDVNSLFTTSNTYTSIHTHKHIYTHTPIYKSESKTMVQHDQEYQKIQSQWYTTFAKNAKKFINYINDIKHKGTIQRIYSYKFHFLSYRWKKNIVMLKSNWYLWKELEEGSITFEKEKKQ